MYLGIDWASQRHAVCVVDDAGRKATAFASTHTADGFDQLLARLRAAPAGLRGTLEVEAHRDAVLAMGKALGALLAAPKDLDRSVLAHLGEHPDAEIFTPRPRSGPINAAPVLAQWGEDRPAYADAEAVACLAGATPVTNQSAKHPAVQFRWAGNKRPPRAICTFADNSRHGSPWAAKLHADALARGHDHPHAVPVLARAWIRGLWRCWIDQVPYDPAKHGAARKLTETAASAA
jgi:hypothetical protein